jgi:hypothetical protein
MKILKWSLLALAAVGAVLLSTAHAAGFALLGVGLGGKYALSGVPPRHWQEWVAIACGIVLAVGGVAMAFFK